MTTTTSTQTRTQLGIGSTALPMIRNRSRLIAGVIAVAFACLLSSVVYGEVNDRTDVLVLSRNVEQGHVITAGDLTIAEVALSGNMKSFGPAERSTLVGQVASTHLASGTMLSPGVVTPAGPMKPGSATAAALMKPGQYPASMRTGDRVRLITPSASGTSADAAPATSIDGTVTSIDRASDTSGAVSISFVIDERFADAVASAGATGNLAAVVLPR